jgi:hypothetical protein
VPSSIGWMRSRSGRKGRQHEKAQTIAKINERDFADLLKVPQRYDQNAHIAGGCLRDTLLQRPTKDIDLFAFNVFDEVDRDFRANGFEIQHFRRGPLRSNPEITQLAEYKSPGGTIINLIGLSRPMTMKENLERFDFGICRIGFDGDIFPHPDFERDRKDKRFVLRRCDSREQFERSMMRVNRFSTKYPGWELVIPSEFLKFAMASQPRRF